MVIQEMMDQLLLFLVLAIHLAPAAAVAVVLAQQQGETAARAVQQGVQILMLDLEYQAKVMMVGQAAVLLLTQAAVEVKEQQAAVVRLLLLQAEQAMAASADLHQ
jgi:hypothetical protein